MTAAPQQTIERPVTIAGVGLHTGEPGAIRFLPAEPGSGVRFMRTDLEGRPVVRVRPENARFDPQADHLELFERQRRKADRHRPQRGLPLVGESGAGDVEPQ